MLLCHNIYWVDKSKKANEFPTRADVVGFMWLAYVLATTLQYEMTLEYF